MNCCYLIDLEGIKCHTGTKFHAMVTERNVSDVIKIAHDLHVQRVLGKECYAWLCESLALEGLPTRTTFQQDALDSAKAFQERLLPWLAWLVVGLILGEPRHVRINANGIGHSTASSRAPGGGEFKPASEAEQSRLRATALNYSKGYLQAAIEWLSEESPLTGQVNGKEIPCFEKESCQRQRGSNPNPSFWVY